MRYLVLLLVAAMVAGGAVLVAGDPAAKQQALMAGAIQRARLEPAERAEYWPQQAALAGAQAARQGEIVAGVVLAVGGVLAGLLAAAVQSVNALRREMAGRRP